MTTGGAYEPPPIGYGYCPTCRQIARVGMRDKLGTHRVNDVPCEGRGKHPLADGRAQMLGLTWRKASQSGDPEVSS